jgi:ubiquinone/menaquinone biosynthesis C-methylase UbiE
MSPAISTHSHGLGYWERHARRYDRATYVLSRRPVARMLELAVDAARGKRHVLEVAAGTGLVTTAIAPVVGELIATDYAARMVEQFQARIQGAGLGNVRCERADLAALPFGPASFDAVVAANVLHLLPDLEHGLDGLRRVLRPGGILIAPTYLHGETRFARILSRLVAATGFPIQRRFTSRSLHAAIAAAGFQIARTETIPGGFPVGFVAAIAPNARDIDVAPVIDVV